MKCYVWYHVSYPIKRLGSACSSTSVIIMVVVTIVADDVTVLLYRHFFPFESQKMVDKATHTVLNDQN